MMVSRLSNHGDRNMPALCLGMAPGSPRIVASAPRGGRGSSYVFRLPTSATGGGRYIA